MKCFGISVCAFSYPDLTVWVPACMRVCTCAMSFKDRELELNLLVAFSWLSLRRAWGRSWALRIHTFLSAPKHVLILPGGNSPPFISYPVSYRGNAVESQNLLVQHFARCECQSLNPRSGVHRTPPTSRAGQRLACGNVPHHNLVVFEIFINYCVTYVFVCVCLCTHVYRQVPWDQRVILRSQSSPFMVALGIKLCLSGLQGKHFHLLRQLASLQTTYFNSSNGKAARESLLKSSYWKLASSFPLSTH